MRRIVDQMTKTIQLDDVPDEVHRVLTVRAAAAGLSLSDYVKRNLEESVAGPTRDEIDARVASHGPSELSTEFVVSTLRDLRDA
jgi:antitoxin FitA